ncbi:histidinol-phosphatase [Devosia pacifica]|nr:histidinol-phosphatase [Devosia pacifica]
MPRKPLDQLGTLIEVDAVESLLLDAADAARHRTLALFRTSLAVDNKLSQGFDPVTDADRDAETAIRAMIEERFPDHGIIGEEHQQKSSDSPFTWIIDPIDGTRAFISGVPVWGTLIGLRYRGQSMAGLMAQPFTGETWWSVGGKAQYSHRDLVMPVHVSGVQQLEQARTTATAPELFSSPDTQRAWQAVSSNVLQVRYGLDCYGYCLLALGQIDMVMEAGLKDVDIAPLIPIIEAAGGIVTTWTGESAENGGDCVAAATPELHQAALRKIAESQ